MALRPARRVALHQPAAAGNVGGLGAIADTQLCADVADVLLDRLRGDQQLRGDLAVGQASGEAFQTRNVVYKDGRDQWIQRPDVREGFVKDLYVAVFPSASTSDGSTR